MIPFGPTGFQQALKFREESAKLPVREVPRADFLAALIAGGMDEREASLQATVAATLGSDIRVGGELLRIK